MFHLLPGRAIQTREQIRNRLLIRALDNKFLLIQHNSLFPFSIIRHLVVEDEDKSVFYGLDGATSHGRSNRKTTRYRSSVGYSSQPFRRRSR